MSNGGPAFPINKDFPVINGESFHGMSLRDYFACSAMNAELISSGSEDAPAQALADEANANGITVEQQIAWNAYSLADAMLAERAKAEGRKL